ncbi:MAG TPA: helix-turn-helix transcriptional regulator [Rhizomicrobium sp.]|jgi:transcriptional regulator with XRE-family HTH domain
MSYQSEGFTQLLRSRREGGRMSQRELGTRSGLTQAHISQIESGKLEPGLDSFIDLARALDYELVLVPKHLVPAVEGLMRQTRSRELSPEEGQTALQTINRGERLLKKLKALYGSSAELDRIADALRYLKQTPLRSDDVERITGSLETLKSHGASGQSRDLVTKVGALLQDLRNRYSHAPQEALRAAYAFDGDEDADA